MDEVRTRTGETERTINVKRQLSANARPNPPKAVAGIRNYKHLSGSGITVTSYGSGPVLEFGFVSGLELGLEGQGMVWGQCVIIIEIAVNQKIQKTGQFLGVLFSKMAP